MELRPALQIKTVIHALEEAILPALDPKNIMAQEQGQLAVSVLNMISRNLPLQYQYDRLELSEFVGLASSLTTQSKQNGLASEALTALQDCLGHSTQVLQRAQADPTELEQANRNLREYLGLALSSLCASASAEQLKPLYATVLEHAEAQLLRERSWVSEQNWEADISLPALASLLEKSTR